MRVVAAACALLSIAPASIARAQELTLSVWAQQDYSHLAARPAIADALTSVFDDWARAHPDVQLRVSVMPGLEMHEAKLQLAAAAGRLPDVASIDSFWLPLLMNDVQPLKAFWPEDDRRDFLPFTIVPVPPSRKRAHQPVIEIAKAIGTRLSVPVNEMAVTKIKGTPELKDVFDYGERIRLMDGAFQINLDAVRGKRILFVDDLYRSGATATVVAQALLSAGAATVHMLAMTKTRTRT